MDFMSILLVLLLVVPAATAALVAGMGPDRTQAVRRLSLAATLVSLVLALVLAGHFMSLTRESSLGFSPELVPGDPGVVDKGVVKPSHTTTWNILLLGQAESGGPAPVIQFYIGLDGLNVWLMVLVALLMVPAVLVSWNAIAERTNEYYAWLLMLGAAMMGVFLAFDIVLFYVFFELTLVPLFFLIGIWGGPQKQHAARKFFIYTLAGSLITLLGVLGVVLAGYSQTKVLTFSIPELVKMVQTGLASPHPQEVAFWRDLQPWVFLALMVGFAIKVPLVPVHTWLPLAHVEAPTAGSVLLAGVLLKIGAYGFLRLCVPLAPDASVAIGVPLIATLAVIGIIYGAWCSLAQDDIKKLIAYSSVSHLGFCMLGMFALNEAGLAGSLLQMVNHGLSTGALFLLVGMLYERYHTRKMNDYGGMAARLKLLGLFMVLTCLSSVGLPGLNGFVGEALVFLGAFDGPSLSSPTMAIFGTLGIVLGAWYLLTMLMRVFFGPVKEPLHDSHAHVHDLDLRELAALVPLAVLFVVLGVYPQPVIETARPDLKIVADIADKARRRGTEAARTVPSPQTTQQASAKGRGEER
jgi:NADH-quinone oxidoreductase subunit M